ncbi:hypothetical protein IF1G_08197 [Cordyceps javanica]|uniref:Uncharacterized protein n=1 Tax=Cordyceps javanica TaxID=43265 RepID=A0A545UTU4_9HYPO|nr:hypothetical protein IF1G_08197 [Cordyceps javanica]
MRTCHLPVKTDQNVTSLDPTGLFYAPRLSVYICGRSRRTVPSACFSCKKCFNYFYPLCSTLIIAYSSNNSSHSTPLPPSLSSEIVRSNLPSPSLFAAIVFVAVVCATVQLCQSSQRLAAGWISNPLFFSRWLRKRVRGGLAENGRAHVVHGPFVICPSGLTADKILQLARPSCHCDDGNGPRDIRTVMTRLLCNPDASCFFCSLLAVPRCSCARPVLAPPQPAMDVCFIIFFASPPQQPKKQYPPRPEFLPMLPDKPTVTRQVTQNRAVGGYDGRGWVVLVAGGRDRKQRHRGAIARQASLLCFSRTCAGRERSKSRGL